MKHRLPSVPPVARLRQTVEGAVRPVILIYANPDPDALASAWALRELLRTWEVNASIHYTGSVGRLENRAMLSALRIPATPVGVNDIADSDCVALVDAQPSFFHDSLLPRCDVVIDHHPVTEETHVSYADIRPRCVATSSILTEYLTTEKVPVSSRLATALYYGIQTDGRYTEKFPTSTDRDALVYLEGRYDRMALRRIESSSYSLSQLDYFSIALTKLRYCRGVLYSNIGPVPSSDVCVQIVDFLVRVKEANWALVSGVVGRKLVVVFRCDGHRKDAGRTALAAFGPYGSAGGHRSMGRAEVDESALPQDIILTQNERVERFVIESLAKVEKGFRPLQRSAKY